MSLQFVLGSSGAGKSHWLFRRTIEQAERHPDRTYLVIVPEQFTMQTQKELVALSDRSGIMNIDILSFERLAHRILEEVGKDRRPILEEVGKIMVLERVIQEKEKELGVLARSMQKPGTVAEVKSLVSEFMQYEIRPEELDEIKNRVQENPLLSHKLQDVQVIYQGYIDYLKERYLTSEEVLDVLYERIGESRLMKHCEIVLDGFTGFTPIQNKLMRKLLTLADKVWVSVTVDEQAMRGKIKSPHQLFYMSGQMIEKLRRTAYEEHVEIKQDIWVRPGKNSRFAGAGALSYAERHLFRYGQASYEEEQQEIHIFAAPNPRAEMEEIARRMRRLVRTEGYRYGDMAVITGDLPAYASYARQIMQQSEIPCFIDEKHSILMNPFVEYLRAAMNLLSEHFSYESVFRYLRCGMSGLSLYETDVLENYCIAIGIRGFAQWQEHWVRRYRGMAEGSIEEINEIREKFLDEVGNFAALMSRRGQTVAERTRILYDFICRLDIQNKLAKEEKRFEEQKDMALAREYGQIYGIIMNLLDKMVQVLGNEKVSLDHYVQLLEAGLAEARVGVIPPTADQVLVGDVERTRLKNIKVLFFAGVNDQVIPKKGGNGGLLSENDREYLAGRRVELAPTAREQAYIQKFYLYLNLTKPSKRLCLSYAKSSGQGQPMAPAYLIPMLCRMFPKLTVQEPDPTHLEQMELPYQAVPYILEGLSCSRSKEPDDAWKELWSWYLRSPQWSKLCDQWLDSAFLQAPCDTLGKSVARALYGTVLEGSVTRLEQFSACAFAHFLQYGLQVCEREEYQFRSADMGNILHQALEQFSHNLKKQGLLWRELSDETREALIDESVEEIIHDYGNTILESDARKRYMILRIKRILRRTVWALQEQLKAGKYEPGGFELTFAMEGEMQALNFSLSKEERLRLGGRIDRTDRYEEDHTIYIKIIDYKSGNTSLDLVALYHGLQMQLVVYMNAALELEQREHPAKEVEPAGIFYYHVRDPLLDGDARISEEELRQKILASLKPDGLVRSDTKIITDMDGTLEGGGKSMILPVSYNKDGSLAKTSHVASREQFQVLSRYVNEKICEAGKKILAGDVRISPYILKNRSACDYCSYKSVCGFDEKLPGYRYRRLPAFADEELWKKLRGEEEG